MNDQAAFVAAGRSARFVHATARITAGITAALAALCALLLVFGPISDHSAEEIAARPHAQNCQRAGSSSMKWPRGFAGSVS